MRRNARPAVLDRAGTTPDPPASAGVHGVGSGAVEVRAAAALCGLLAAFRARRGWSQEELADRSGLSVRAIRDLERGRVRRPRRASLVLLADAFGLTDTERGAVAEALGEGQPAAFVAGSGQVIVGTGEVSAASAVRARLGDVVVGADGRVAPALVAARELVRGPPGGEPQPAAVPAGPGVSVPFGLLPSLAVPAQLPAAVTAFTGRRGQLDELDAVLLGRNSGRLPEPAVAVITGSAGVGKTALALRWAHRARGAFPDGQLFADLRGYTQAEPVRPVEVLAAFLHAVGVPGERVPAGVEEAAGLYRTLLADRRVLVVLDNAHSPGQVRPLLPGGPGCGVVVTSRDSLSGLVAREGAHQVGVDVLTPMEAKQLLARTVGGERVGAEPGAAAELARLCARLPLALRIAAAQLTSEPQALAGYVAELGAGDRLSALQAGGDEQAAVRAAFDASYHGLPTGARRLFRLLGLVPGVDLTRDAAAALAGITAGEASILLGRLVSAHLLNRQAGGRFGGHDLLRLYAAERCEHEDSQQDRAAAIQRLLEWYLHAADGAARVLYQERLRLPVPRITPWPRALAVVGRAEALAWLDAERPTMVALARHAASHGPRHLGWLLADTLRGYFWLRMCLVDWLAVAQAGLAAAEAGGNLRAQAAALLSLGEVHIHRGEHQVAADRAAAALALMRRTSWLKGQATTLTTLGNLHYFAGRQGESEACYTSVLAIRHQTGSLTGQAVSLINLGCVYHESGQLDRATECEARALTLSREVGFRVGEALASCNLGQVRHAQGRLDDALGLLTHALGVLRATGNRGVEGETLRLLAGVHADAGHQAQVLGLANSALTLARDTGDRRREADALNTLAACHRRVGDHAHAAELHRQALQIARHTEIRYPQATALIGLATADQRADCAARAHADEALTLTRETGYRCLEGRALSVLASIHLTTGQPEQALAHAQQALAIHRETGQRLHQAHTHLLVGHALRPTQGPEAALPHWREALTLLTDARSPYADHAHRLIQDPANSHPGTIDLPMA